MKLHIFIGIDNVLKKITKASNQFVLHINKYTIIYFSIFHVIIHYIMLFTYYFIMLPIISSAMQII